LDIVPRQGDPLIPLGKFSLRHVVRRENLSPDFIQPLKLPGERDARFEAVVRRHNVMLGLDPPAAFDRGMLPGIVVGADPLAADVPLSPLIARNIGRSQPTESLVEHLTLPQSMRGVRRNPTVADFFKS